MRELLLKILLRGAEALANNEYPLIASRGRGFRDAATASKATQLLLMAKYREMVAAGVPLPSFWEAGFSAYSDNEEDGILLMLFAVVGATNRRCVELCCGSGIDFNTANLLINHGWEGLLIDGNERKLAIGRKFYNRCKSTRQWQPRMVSEWVTAENVNDVVRKQGFEGDIDLFSLDMDGVDYWIWKALTVVRPRVMVLEYQDILGPERAVTVPYDPKFVCIRGKYGTDYAGASLRAYVKLGREKGYRLVGCEHYGYNAFFLREDVGRDLFPEVTVESCFAHPKNRFGMEKRFPKVAGMKWEEV